MDIGYVGLPYTLFAQTHIATVFEILVGAVVNQQWFNLYKDARAENLPIAGSQLNSPNDGLLDRGRKVSSIRFEAKWLFANNEPNPSIS